MTVNRGLTRINSFVRNGDAVAIKALARREGLSVSRAIRKIIEEHLELLEDSYLNRLASHREATSRGYLTFEEMSVKLKKQDRKNKRG